MSDNKEPHNIDLNEFLNAPITQKELDGLFMQIDAGLELDRLPPPTAIEVDFLLSMRMFVCRVAYNLNAQESQPSEEVNRFKKQLELSPVTSPDTLVKRLQKRLSKERRSHGEYDGELMTLLQHAITALSPRDSVRVSREEAEMIKTALQNVKANGVKAGYFADSTMYSVEYALAYIVTALGDKP